MDRYLPEEITTDASRSEAYPVAGRDHQFLVAVLFQCACIAAQAASDLLELIQQWGILDRRPNE